MAALAIPASVDSFANRHIEPYRPLRKTSPRNLKSSYDSSKRSVEDAAFKSSVLKASTNDSSDDEDLAPIKLSAEAQAILGEDNSRPEQNRENIPPHLDGGYEQKELLVKSTRNLWMSENQPSAAQDGSPVPRLVRPSGSRPSPPRVLARDGSFMYKVHEKTVAKSTLQDTNTPAPSLRRIRISGSRTHTRSPPSSLRGTSVGKTSGSTDPENDVNGQYSAEREGDEYGPVHPSTISRSRRGEEVGIHSTMRVRRIGTGTLLNGPVRRGMIRRQSEEDDEQLHQQPRERETTPEVEHGRRAKEPDLEDLPDEIPKFDDSPRYETAKVHHDDVRASESETKREMRKASPVANNIQPTRRSPVQNHILSTSIGRSNPTPASDPSFPSRSSSSNRKPIFKIPALPPLESAHDQENEPPPTFKRNKPSAQLVDIHEDPVPASSEMKPNPPHQQQSRNHHESPSRQPLAARSKNTPHRAAPMPPPKMSLIDAATSAGANSRSKKSVHYVLNGRTYRRLDCIGRGGSSRVFRIMAENYKIFALKRVNLEEADMAAIAGYKGEIDLLKKLENVDRVIRLFDYEVNEDKGVLSVMMELGESDFNKMLNEQLKGENAKLDITFTRHYWKEMLECVKAVHDQGVVHSDLKPANFLLVKGQLKLIDFGIAGAIQDNTVNVHRENQIGTPNYMSPESLVCHTPAVGQPAGTKLLKLGKPSDVWSLGCILYQMTYGQPPFAHITKQFERIMSIPNPKVEIQFPGTGIGGAVVPFGLIKTLRLCLQRDQTLRPSVDELLSESDPFLHPVAISSEMLGRVIGNVVGFCRKREEKLREEGKLQIQDGLSVLPKDDEMRGWPGAFYAKLKEAGREGTAW